MREQYLNLNIEERTQLGCVGGAEHHVEHVHAERLEFVPQAFAQVERKSLGGGVDRQPAVPPSTASEPTNTSPSRPRRMRNVA